MSLPLTGQELEKCDQVKNTVKGTLTTNSSTKPIIKKSTGEPPKKGDRGELLVHVERELFGGIVKADLLIATAEVTKVSGKTIELNVLKEHSNMVVNGAKKKPF